jgi:NAD(P)-dependent dehydrogenase (short-subunit alcohol dehydrogenase family)
MRLRGKRVLIVGASSGIGRATAVGTCRAGARTAIAARRLDRLQESMSEAGDLAGPALVCDVRSEPSCQETVDDAVAALGGLDAIVYASGIGIFEPLVNAGAEDWRDILETNLVGASLMIRAAIPHLTESRGKVVLFSSITIDDRPPRHSNAPYVVSKVGLETLAAAWQNEHREVGFTTLAIGDTFSEFGSSADPSTLGSIVQHWVERDYMYGRAMDASAVAEQVVNVLASAETVRRLAITPRYADEND